MDALASIFKVVVELLLDVSEKAHQLVLLLDKQWLVLGTSATIVHQVG